MTPLWSLAFLMAAAFAALAVHEAGHLLAGRLVGFRFGLLAVGPVWIWRAGASVRTRWRWSPKYWGPMAMAFPPDGDRIGPRVFAYVAGGPAASLALAVFAYVLGQFSEITASRQVLTATALMSAGIFVATAQPFGTGVGIPSDGARLLIYAVDSEAANNLAAAVALDGLTRQGIRPRDWDRALIDRAARVTAPPAFALAVNTSLFRRALDLQDHPAALARIQTLRALIDRVPPALRGAAAAEIAFWMEHFEHDREGARRFLAATGVSAADLEWAAAPRA